MCPDQGHHSKCVVCDWKIEDEGIKVEFRDKHLDVCSDECAVKFRETPVKYFLAVVVAIFLGLNANPAIAGNSGEAYKIILAEREKLVSRYDNTSREVDELEKQIAVLKRSMSNEAKHAEEELEKELSAKSHDLKDLDFQIKDLDQVLKTV